MRKYLGQSLPNIFIYGWLFQCTICLFQLQLAVHLCCYGEVWSVTSVWCSSRIRHPGSLKDFIENLNCTFIFFLLCRTLIKATRVMCSFLLLSLWPLHLFLFFSVSTTQQWVCCHELLQYSYSSVLLCPLGLRYLHRQVTGNHLDRLTVVQSICQTLS